MNCRMTPIAVLFLLTACDSWTLPFPAPIPPANLTAPAPEIEPLKGPADMGDVVRWCASLATEYRQCRERHNELSGLVTP